MPFILGLATSLFAIWLGLSGHYTPLLLSLGVVSVGLSVAFGLRLNIVDREGSPYGALIGFFLYLPWLIVEIAKANIDVVRACLRADLDICPTLVKVKTRCTTDLAKTVFANSITLTPGTVTVEVEGDKLLVHGLYEAAAQPEAFEEMDRRSSIAMDGKRGMT